MSSAAAISAERLHADGVEAFANGDSATATDLLRQAALRGVDATVLNDLAVVLAAAGEHDRAKAVLETCLTLDPADADARDNLAQIGTDTRSWRRSQTLGGDDPTIPERAYPGMLYAGTMAEHAMRYSLALGVLPGAHILDVGCGTGYGSEMLTWKADSVRGFDLWQPAAHERPQWSGGAELTYGFDVTKDPLPKADSAVMFEVLEHLHDAPAALRNVFSAVSTLMASFPNPQYHGSHINHHHVNDWPLARVEEEITKAATVRFQKVKLTHLYQPLGMPTILPGRDPEAPFWIFVATAEGEKTGTSG
jgi:2-polyprenyl-3-methyl-5-hydroxy-6-metoxy-1,4-benzoquinol methylase